MAIIKEFREFALKGNVIDLAVGVIIGAAFGKIINSLIEDIIMPLIGQVAKVDFSQYKYVLIHEVKAADKVTQAEVAIRFGNFATIAINFVILAFCIFMIVKVFNAARRRFEKEQPAPAPAGPTMTESLLMQIRDELKAKK
jgi:large conductance mechanosensitive channel